MTPPLLRTSERKDWRRCADCLIELPPSEFSANQRACKGCQRERKLLRRYGITSVEFEAFYEEQAGYCAICPTKLEPLGKGTHVDHEGPHDPEDRGWNGKPVRGLLCARCNMALGWYELWKEEVDEYLASAATSDK